MIPAATHGVLCTGAPSAGVSMDATLHPQQYLKGFHLNNPNILNIWWYLLSASFLHYAYYL
jgi:hypothetical protein